MQLQELKKQLDQCRQDLSHSQTLIQQREFKLEKIHELKQSIEAKLVLSHQLNESNQNKIEALNRQISEESEQLELLKKAVREIDHQLDQIGEEKGASFSELKKELIQNIQTNYPESKDEYILLENQLKKEQSLLQALVHQKEQLLPFFNLLNEGAKIKLHGGLMMFLLGSHPKAQLARVIQKAAEIAHTLSAKVKDEHLLIFLEKFQKEAAKTWNKDLYSGKFSELYEEFSAFMTEKEQSITRASRLIIEKEQQIEAWIERHCLNSP